MFDANTKSHINDRLSRGDLSARAFNTQECEQERKSGSGKVFFCLNPRLELPEDEPCFVLGYN
jgi:hypothetical protein